AWRGTNGGTTTLYAYGDPDTTSYSAGELNTISTDDNNAISLGFGDGPPAPVRAGHRLKFHIEQEVEDIIGLAITVKSAESWGGAPSPMSLYLGNEQSSSWELLDSEAEPEIEVVYTLTGNQSSSIEDYV